MSLLHIPYLCPNIRAENNIFLYLKNQGNIGQYFI
jgi:hypothetical protein